MKAGRFFAVAFFGVMLCSISFGAIYGGGSGTADDPYQIWTPEQMNTIGANFFDWGKCFKLMADLDMSIYTGTQYRIIGDSATKFTGTFDGNGHVIRNLTYTSTTLTTYTGLFGFTNNAAIKNLGLENVNLSAISGYAGAFAGSQVKGVILNCYSTGLVSSSYATVSTATAYAGGLVGKLDQGTITDCYSTCSVTDNNSGFASIVGGLVGMVSNGTVSDCYGAGTVTCRSRAGGLVGSLLGTLTNSYNRGSVTVIFPAGNTGGNTGLAMAGGLAGTAGNISNCYNTGSVSCTSYSASTPNAYAGGLTAMNGTITGCYNTGSVTSSSLASYSYAGGLTGWQNGHISKCYSKGSVTSYSAMGAAYAGGLTGRHEFGITDSCCSTDSVVCSSSSGMIGADALAGGVAGLLYRGSITNSYSTCSIRCDSLLMNSYAGGLVGLLLDNYEKKIEKCYSTGPIAATGKTVYQGGLAGYQMDRGVNEVVVKSFWDTETSGLDSSAGGTGKTTAEMKSLSTYVTNWVVGKSDNAMQFDGIGDYIEVPDYHGVAGSNARTVSVWFKTSIGVATPANRLPPSISLVQWGHNDAAGELWNICLKHTRQACVYGSVSEKSTSMLLNDGQWHNLIVVLPEVIGRYPKISDIQFYVDGQLDNAAAFSGTAAINTNTENMPVSIGRAKPVSGNYYGYFQGLIDDVRIYDRGLEPSEIQLDNLTDDGLVAHWALDEMEGNVAHDIVSGYDGQVYNSCWDFVGEIFNGTEDIWYMRDGMEYPRLVSLNQTPIADAGDDISVHSEPNGFAAVQLDGSASSDEDGDLLSYNWSWEINQQEFTADGVAPVIPLPLGTYKIMLIVNDGIVDSEPNTVMVTVYNTAPVANAGDDITAYSGFDGDVVEMTLDGSGSVDDDGDTLTYQWYLEGTLLSEEVNPTVSLSAGEYVITLIVNDGIVDSQADEVVVTVVGPIRARVTALPCVVNLKSHDQYVWIMMDLPRGISMAKLDRRYGYFVLPGQICPSWVGYAVGWYPKVMARVEKDALRPYLHTGRMELTFYGRLKDGRYIGGKDKIHVINPPDNKQDKDQGKR